MSAHTPISHGLIERMYGAYNERDLDALTAFVGEDVDWPDGGERLYGRAAVRNYWSCQWVGIRIQDKVTGIIDLADDRATVRISQIVRNLDGAILSTGEFEHVYRFKNGLVERMDVWKL